MSKATGTQSTVRLVVFVIVAQTLVACNRSNPTEASQLAQDMKGTWVHVGQPGNVREMPAEGGRFKFRTGKHWTLVRADPDGLVTEQFGGTYTLNGDEYVETQQYADSHWIQDNGKSFKFKVKVEGDTMTQVGIGNPYTEVWKRAK